MGAPVSILEALAIESLTQALKSAAFVLPSGLGVQEGGFVLLGSLLGLQPDEALAVSIAKRIPDLVLGLPSLAAWHAIERRQATRTASGLVTASGTDPGP